MTRYWIRVFLLALLSVLPLEAKDSCVECHSALEGSLLTPTQAFSADVHQHRGFSCADCHGGDSSLDDPDGAMSPKRGFLGKIKRIETPKLCARCHSDANLIHKFRPQQRVDQYAQYQTSVHGKRMAVGDASAANCVDCHSVHDIREVKDSRSPVHPLRLPETCARCHANPAHMAKYKLPTNQFEDYRKSVHWEALAQRGDLSAPSCASCHGNHGATPPQVSSVAAVCGTCHALVEDCTVRVRISRCFPEWGSPDVSFAMETMLFRGLQTPCWQDLMRCAPSVMRKVLREERPPPRWLRALEVFSRRSNARMIFSELPSVPAWRLAKPCCDFRRDGRL